MVLGGPSRMPGIKPGPAVGKANALSTIPRSNPPDLVFIIQTKSYQQGQERELKKCELRNVLTIENMLSVVYLSHFVPVP